MPMQQQVGDLRFDYAFGTPDERTELMKMLGLNVAAMSANDLRARLAEVVQGAWRDPLSVETVTGLGDLMICPIAYRLARDAGFDPAGIMLLEMHACYITVKSPQWTSNLRFSSHDAGLQVEAPLADGITWLGGWPGSGPLGHHVFASELKIDTERFPLPDTIVAALTGQKLGSLLQHPLLSDDLVIRKAERADDDDDASPLEIRFTTSPTLVRLADAAASHSA